MNHVISILLISLFAAFLSACDDENTSVSAAPVPASSASVAYVPASSASVPASSASVVHSSPLYIAEIGYVCNGFSFDNVVQSKATEAYIAMNKICGDRHTETTGANGISASSVVTWMYGLNFTSAIVSKVANTVDTYGMCLYWYKANDGYIRYIYIEPIGDGRGLFKRK